MIFFDIFSLFDESFILKKRKNTDYIIIKKKNREKQQGKRI